MTPDTKATPIRLSPNEAARLFGIHEKTIRRAIKEGAIRYVVVRGRYKLLFESVLSWSQRTTTVRNKRDHAGIGQWVGRWDIRNTHYSPRAPEEKT
jgi:excisionase family DNA binding protein